MSILFAPPVAGVGELEAPEDLGLLVAEPPQPAEQDAPLDVVLLAPGVDGHPALDERPGALAPHLDRLLDLQGDLLGSDYRSGDRLLSWGAVKRAGFFTKHGNSELEHWAECEIEGYGAGDVPDYRIAKGLNFTYTGYNNGAFQVTNAPLPIAFLRKETLDNLKYVPFAEGISSIEGMSDGDSIVHVDRSNLAVEVSNCSEGGISCVSISQNFTTAFFKGVIDKVTTRAIKALMMLEDQYGCLDNLGIVVESKKAASENNAIINNIFNNGSSSAHLTDSAQKERLGSKVTWMIVAPILTAVAGGLLTAWVMNHLPLG